VFCCVPRTQVSIKEPDPLPPGALIHVSEHIGSLKYRVWEKMMEMVEHSEQPLPCPYSSGVIVEHLL